MKTLESKKLPILLCLISGVLLALPWYESFTGLILLFAFTPLLYAEHLLSKKGSTTWNVMLHVALTFAVWAALDTWWIMNAAIAGLVAAIIIHTIFGSIVIGLFHITKKRLGKFAGYISLVFFWIAYEHFYTNAEISFPWLTLGNGFAKDILLIQWYEFTGVLGGSLWALLSNIILFHAFKSFLEQNKKKGYKLLGWSAGLIILPAVASLIIFNSIKETGEKVNVAILQPNIDPYSEKFGGMSNEDQAMILLNLAEAATDSNTSLVFGPETALQGSILEEGLSDNPSVAMVMQFAKRHPNTAFIVGMTSIKTYFTTIKPTPTARKSEYQDLFYDRYNAALQVDTAEFQIYHKSKLVVGVEKMPYINLLPFIEKLALNMGGTIGSLGTQEDRFVFQSANKNIRVAPAICYESVYGEYFTEWIKNGANIGAVITNDGWWGNTPGYRQHLTYSSIRAIETRRYIARSANTGVSAIINTKGEIVNKLGWWQRGYLKGDVIMNDKITTYVIWGDYIGRISTMLALLMLPVLLVQFLKKKKAE